MAAYREGMKTVLIPKANESDLYDVDGEVKKAIRFLPMSNVAQVLSIALLKPKAVSSAKRKEAVRKNSAVVQEPAATKPAAIRQ